MGRHKRQALCIDGKVTLPGYGFSSVRLGGWRHLETQNYRKVPGEVFKGVEADRA